ncbi:hypothetical protein [Brumimicrobium aurantiacum]|uniref:DUF5103 domain-containing protein n=1 Tax=Brumimicrobium aurantiacum TaxID=1737063 RepID=A0A3E1EUC4_9FLAO|nr:hypothetical protein [Brumimicrobium aurantiacum]RFC53161.1 hypothetical protein DXU93_14470 [Brumimicrobium aurantiacum]
MIYRITLILLVALMLHPDISFGQNDNTSQLHIKLVHDGITYPLIVSNNYPTSKNYKIRTVFSTSTYYSRIYILLKSKDTSDVFPKENHKIQSGRLSLKSDQNYQLKIIKQDGFNLNIQDSMVISIKKLEKDAQLILDFKKGKYQLEKMKTFQTLKKSELPHFNSYNFQEHKIKLKLDSTAYFKNGNVSVKYFLVTKNFPLIYVQEFDSINPSKFAQGFRLITAYKHPQGPQINLGNWTQNSNNKYGYWEYFQNENKYKHEFWSSVLLESYEWFNPKKLKEVYTFQQRNYNTTIKVYFKNGLLKSEFTRIHQPYSAELKEYNYNEEQNLILLNVYHSDDGILKNKLKKRLIYYPTGKLKMEEKFDSQYNIKYYNEDGTERK